MEYELRRGELRARAAARGGELVSLRDAEGTQYLWQSDPAIWPGRSLNLFPIVGRLKNGTVTCGGKPYRMGLHGFARDRDFELASLAGDEAVLRLREDEGTLAQYPFRFSLQIRYKLLADGFSKEFQVENTDRVPLPFCIGGHTAFRCPLLPGERFEDYQLVFDRTEDVCSPLPTPEGCISHDRTGHFLRNTDTLPLDYSLFAQNDTLIFRGLRSKTVSLLHKRTGRGVRLDFSQFPMVAFWTKPGAPFLCLEPWHGCAALDNESGRFEDKPCCIRLLPGEQKTLGYTVTLVPGR